MIRLEDFSTPTPANNDLSPGLQEAINSLTTTGEIIDCTYYRGNYNFNTPINTNKSCVIRFGAVHLTMNNTSGTNMFNIQSDSVTIEGTGRSANPNNLTEVTTFEMTNADTTLNGYHVKGRGYGCFTLRSCNLIGIRTSCDRQYNNPGNRLNGVGGIYLEKASSGPISTPGNTVNQICIDNVFIKYTKSHAIYLDTPILSSIMSTRISGAGGHGIFINGGTSVQIQTVYVASANYAAFLVKDLSYSTLSSCAAEGSGIGYWLRGSCTCVNLISPGCESLYNLGTNPWQKSYPATNKYGMNLNTTDGSGSDYYINDVGSDHYNQFLGTGILITGGYGIGIFSPYIFHIGEPLTETIGLSPNTRYIKIYGTTESVQIINPKLKLGAGYVIANRYDMEISDGVVNSEIVWNVGDTTLQSYTSPAPVTSNTAHTAPVFCASPTTLIRSGNKYYTKEEISGKVRINPVEDPSNDSYNEGIRIGKANNGWSIINVRCDSDADSGTIDGQWLVGSTGPSVTVGNFMICHNGSSPSQALMLYKDGSRPKWYNNQLAYISDLNNYIQTNGGTFTEQVYFDSFNLNQCPEIRVDADYE